MRSGQSSSAARAVALSHISLFEACNKKELAKIASITKDAEYQPGAVLCKEGVVGDECFIVLDGKAAVTIDGAEVAVLGDGAIIGELGLLDPGPRTATVTAQTPMHVLVLGRTEFTTLLYSTPDVVRRILVSVARRLRQAEAPGPAKLS
jgi:CRP/FNR family cyclic AMP-dependent transcriptional regulator